MPALRLYLSQGISSDQWNGTEKSELWVARWFKDKIKELSDRQIEVITSIDYPDHQDFTNLVSRDIAGSDAVLCIFTCRHQNIYQNRWFPSSFVVSEGGFARGRYWGDETPDRLFGFVEEGIPVTELGIAFSKHLNLPTFRREAIDECVPRLAEVVKRILMTSLLERPAQTQKVDKQVFVFRSGAVRVSSKYEILITQEPDLEGDGSHREHHSLWRVREALAEVESFIASKPNTDGHRPFLHCKFLSCTRATTKIEAFLDRLERSPEGKEITFDVVFRDLRPRCGDILRYEIAWAYPSAFQSNRRLEEGQSNSAALRSGRRGRIRDASLSVFFERNYGPKGEELPVFDEGPRVWLHDLPVCPHSLDPLQFWYEKDGWKPVGPNGFIEPCLKRSNILFEAYRFQQYNFKGYARMNWIPSLNYQTDEEEPARVTKASKVPAQKTRRARKK